MPITRGMRSVQPQGGRLDRASGRHTRKQRRLRPDRGATLVEYALGVALVCVATLGAAEFMEDGASDDFNDRADRAGAPDLVEASDGGTTDGGSTSGSDGTDGSVPTQEVVFGGFSGATSHGNPSKWTAVIEVSVDDTSGDGVDGARVTGYWSYESGSGIVTEEVTCNQTNNQGICRFQISNVPASATSITFTMTSIGGGVPPVSYNGGEQTSPPIPKPTGGAN